MSVLWAQAKQESKQVANVILLIWDPSQNFFVDVTYTSSFVIERQQKNSLFNFNGCKVSLKHGLLFVGTLLSYLSVSLQQRLVYSPGK